MIVLVEDVDKKMNLLLQISFCVVICCRHLSFLFSYFLIFDFFFFNMKTFFVSWKGRNKEEKGN